MLGIILRRLVGQGMHEDMYITNYGDREADFGVTLHFDADFAHVFDVKRDIQVKKEDVRREGAFDFTIAEEGRSLRFSYERDSLLRRLVVNLSKAPESSGYDCRFEVSIPPRGSWHLCTDFLTLVDEERAEPTYTCARPEDLELRMAREHRHGEMVDRWPKLWTDSYVLQRAYEQSVHDFAALQIKGEDISETEFAIAAGIPWFMALFGRDSLIAAYQALAFYPEAAKGVLQALGRLQGTRVDRLRGEEPGKILHEHRYGVLAGAQKDIPAFPYYGSIDSTPLFLMLLAETYRVTGDLALVVSLRQNALRALEWMDQYGDRDGDGYLEYLREADVGLENQGWKDSFDSVRFSDGTLADPPTALCEVQGYAYAARMGMAGVFEALGEPARAAAERQKAAGLKERFNRDFWLPDRGYYAEALDKAKRPVDSVTSNPGHLLWTGLADDEKAKLVAKRLLSPELFSGWGVRTMAATEGGYNPISYHNGSVWPHDNSLIVAGLARYVFIEEAAKITDGMLAVLGHYPDHRLPELFAGYGLEEAPFPVEYPTASRPQAWASGSVFLLLAAMLGLEIDPWARRIPTGSFLPSDTGRLQVEGLWVGQQRVSIELRRTESGISKELLRHKP